MVYVSKAEKEDARWMPMAEAIDHIMTADGCGRWAARKQLARLIQDSPVTLRWQPLPRGSMLVAQARRRASPLQVLKFVVERTWPNVGRAQAKVTSSIAAEKKVAEWLAKPMRGKPNTPISKAAIQTRIDSDGLPQIERRVREALS